MYSDVESYVELPINGKKTNKPLMEKKRRARINRCLAELKDILIKDNHASAGHAKWEKADILEMTVDYVKKLREQKGLPELTRTTASVPNSVTDEAEDTTVASKSPVSVSSPPSTSSTEFTSIDGPPDAKRRRRSDHLMMPCPVPPSVPHAPTAVHGFNFLAQQYFAMQQFQHNLKLASTAPAIIPGATIPSLPSPVALHIPWRM